MESSVNPIVDSQQHPPLLTINLNRITTLRPKISLTLSTIEAQWQEQHTTPAVSDRKVAARLRQEVESNADSKQTLNDLQLRRPPN